MELMEGGGALVQRVYGHAQRTPSLTSQLTSQFAVSSFGAGFGSRLVAGCVSTKNVWVCDISPYTWHVFQHGSLPSNT